MLIILIKMDKGKRGGGGSAKVDKKSLIRMLFISPKLIRGGG